MFNVLFSLHCSMFGCLSNEQLQLFPPTSYNLQTSSLHNCIFFFLSSAHSEWKWEGDGRVEGESHNGDIRGVRGQTHISATSLEKLFSRWVFVALPPPPLPAPSPLSFVSPPFAPPSPLSLLLLLENKRFKINCTFDWKLYFLCVLSFFC